MCPRANSDYMKCLARIHNFGPKAPILPREDNDNLASKVRALILLDVGRPDVRNEAGSGCLTQTFKSS